MVPVPFLVWDTLAALMTLHPDPPLTPRSSETDETRQCCRGNALTLEDLGIRPISVEEVLPTYINSTV